jgi:fatty acid desaturase
MFNLNRHIHHHESPRTTWYLLEFRTKRPRSDPRQLAHVASKKYEEMQRSIRTLVQLFANTVTYCHGWRSDDQF